jgi:tetratricopeptide (TPR) repeat protein
MPEDKKSRWDWLGKLSPPETPQEVKRDVPIPPTLNETFTLLNEAYNSILNGRLNEAIEICDSLLQKDPQNSDAWYYKGVTLCILAAQQADFNKYIEYIKLAEQCFEQLLLINPNHSEGIFYRGLALVDLERFKEALELFEKFLNNKPKDIMGLYWKSVCLYSLKRYKEAWTCINEVLIIDPTFEEAKDLKELCLMRLK